MRSIEQAHLHVSEPSTAWRAAHGLILFCWLSPRVLGACMPARLDCRRLGSLKKAADAAGRKLAFIGMSLHMYLEAAHRAGQAPFSPREVLSQADIGDMDPNQLLIVTTGSQVRLLCRVGEHQHQHAIGCWVGGQGLLWGVPKCMGLPWGVLLAGFNTANPSSKRRHAWLRAAVSKRARR